MVLTQVATAFYYNCGVPDVLKFLYVFHIAAATTILVRSTRGHLAKAAAAAAAAGQPTRNGAAASPSDQNGDLAPPTHMHRD